MTDSKISALTDGSPLQAADELVIARAGSSLRVAGVPVKVYDYVVAGADKTSIDTDVDGTMAGLFPTNYSVLKVFLQARTDEASVRSVLKMTLNNDTGSNYDAHDLYALNASVATDGPSLAQAAWSLNANGASCAANFFSAHSLIIPAFADTVAYKRATYQASLGDSTAANVLSILFGLGYRSTSAVTRLAITPSTSGKKLKIGTRLTVFAI